MKISAFELENFRKFRKPLSISGISDGLNIIVEPNESGKSTLLEALRAAFFIRHSAKTELVRSYCPFGDDVAPKVSVSFEIGGAQWRVEKQFLKSPYVRLTGSSGQIESDAAEERLQALLGFEKGNNRNSDPETRGALGLLWVEQASAFSAEPPGRLVRNHVRGALEAEVGTILGGRRFDIVCARVEEAYAQLRTFRSGKSTGRLADAEAALVAAQARSAATQANLREYEEALSALEAAQTAKRLIERDLADPEQAQRRQKLNEDLKLAESAQLRLSTAEARHSAGQAAANTAEQLLERIDDAYRRRNIAEQAITVAKLALVEQQAEYDTAVADEMSKRQALSTARSQRSAAEDAVQQARRQKAHNLRHAALARARQRLQDVETLETVATEKLDIATQIIPNDQLQRLATLDRRATEARAVHAAGSVSLDIKLLGDITVLIDGKVASGGLVEVTGPTDISVPDVVRISVKPPMIGARSTQADLHSAEEALTEALHSVGADSYPAAITQNENARAAKQDVDALKRQMETMCFADPGLDLLPGVAPLKALLAAAPPDDIPPDGTLDLEAAEVAFAMAREAEEVAVAVLDEGQRALRSAELSRARLELEQAAAARDLSTALEVIDALPQGHGRDVVEAQLAGAREELGRRSETLAEAKATAANLDADRIRRAISNADIADRQANEERVQLVARIAALESTIAREGPKGPAGAVAEALEAEEAASVQCHRLRHEADTLQLLRETLRLAGDEASRTFLGPVTQRAARYVNRILPGCDLSFDEDMGLQTIRRNGIDEACGDLSRGTQEQLAVLTRLAFADLLLEQDVPVSLILDDPLVYSDDGRLEVMTDILLEAAKRMQVVLLTCRAKAFRHLAGHRITIAD